MTKPLGEPGALCCDTGLHHPCPSSGSDRGDRAGGATGAGLESFTSVVLRRARRPGGGFTGVASGERSGAVGSGESLAIRAAGELGGWLALDVAAISRPFVTVPSGAEPARGRPAVGVSSGGDAGVG
jgi:hypothetical protein